MKQEYERGNDYIKEGLNYFKNTRTVVESWGIVKPIAKDSAGRLMELSTDFD